MKNLFNSVVAEVQLSYVNPVPVSERKIVAKSHVANDLFRLVWSNTLDHSESFYVLLLNRNNQALGCKLISTGGLSGTVVDPKIIFQSALLANATGLILAHNHPSGNTKPSESDIRITDKVIQAGKILEISVLDHLIITSEEFFSFADNGMIS